MTANNRTALTLCLVTVLVSLLLVGVVSSTLLRHAIQVIPLGLMLLLLKRRTAVVACASLPIFAIWLLLMALIWLYLLGIQTVFDGSFSSAEIALTLLIGACSVLGIRECFRLRWSATAYCFIACIAGAVIQIAALWLSFMPSIC